MSGSISRIMAKAYKNVLSNPREAKFAFRMQQLFAKSEKRRKKVKEQEGIDVPPFLICSIAKVAMHVPMALRQTVQKNKRQPSRLTSGKPSLKSRHRWASTLPCWQAASP